MKVLPTLQQRGKNNFANKTRFAFKRLLEK